MIGALNGKEWERDDEDNMELMKIVCTLKEKGGSEFFPKFLTFGTALQPMTVNWKGLSNITTAMFLLCLMF